METVATICPWTLILTDITRKWTCSYFLLRMTSNKLAPHRSVQLETCRVPFEVTDTDYKKLGFSGRTCHKKFILWVFTLAVWFVPSSCQESRGNILLINANLLCTAPHVWQITHCKEFLSMRTDRAIIYLRSLESILYNRVKNKGNNW